MSNTQEYKRITSMDKWTDAYKTCANVIQDFKDYLWEKGIMDKKIYDQYFRTLEDELDNLWSEYSDLRSDAVNLSTRITLTEDIDDE